MREAQLYLKTKHAWQKQMFSAETRYLPSVYIAKLSMTVEAAMDDEDKENLEQALLRVLEEKIKGDFKRSIENTEEKQGFLETTVLMRLSDKLAREVERVASRYQPCRWETAID
jgi:hypothetical protein